MNVAYRADIDGLRAIAVLLVVFNHLGWSFFSGGYIGVDIFFVISGYLISLILVKDLKAQQFSIGRFYKKRVVRLAPAYFTMLSLVSVLAWQVMLPDELIKYAESALYGTFFTANLYMQNEVGDYFSQSVETIPLLHLWSLGVEEQFYIFWPLILFLLFKRNGQRWLLPIVIVGIGASLYYANTQLKLNADKAYYSMFVRAFELLLGAMIVFLPKIQLPYLWSRILVWCALGTIVATAFYFNTETPFPGFMALIPCFLTVLVIYLGQFNATSNCVLNNPLSLWLGKISYPLYLWHWPIIVFSSFYLLPKTLEIQVGLLFCSIVLAWFTYRFVEQPIHRFVSYPNWKVIGIGFLVPALSFSLAAKIVIAQEGFPHRFSATVQKQLNTLNTFAHHLRGKCIGYPSAEKFSSADICRLGVEKENVDFILIGDSHANSASGMLDVWAKDAGLRGYDVAQSSTLYMPDVERLVLKGGQWQNNLAFKKRNDAVTQHLREHHYSMVILTGYYHAYLRNQLRLQDGRYTQQSEILYHGLKRAIHHAERASDQVVMLLDVPELKDVSADCKMRAEILHRDLKCEFSKASEMLIASEFRNVLVRLQHDFPRLKLIDPKKILCRGDICQSSIQGLPIYRNKDDDHLSFKGSEAIGRAYLEKFKNPLQ